MPPLPDGRYDYYGTIYPDIHAAADAQRAERELAEARARGKPSPTAALPTRECQPPKLEDVIGNSQAVALISMMLDAHKARPVKKPFPHALLAGPAGTGKTMLSEIIGHEVGRAPKLQLGQSMNNPAKVTAVMLDLKPNDILFIDEVHGLTPPCQEALYRAMEDRILVPVTRGAEVARPVALPPFTLIAATTDEDGLLPAFRRRFLPYRMLLRRMTPDELAQAMLQRAKRIGMALADDAAALIGRRSMGTPGPAVALLQASADCALAQGEATVSVWIVEMACALLEIDTMGLDHRARQYLTFLSESAGKPVRVNVLASRMDGVSRRSVEMTVEPNLVWLGLIEKGLTGRTITARGREHLRGT
jgi:Holliday junction DNA helicase RuvB